MSILSRVSSMSKAIKKANTRRIKAAEARANASLAKETRKVERERIKTRLAREKLAIRKELYDAQAETRRARANLAKAKREAGDIPVGERIASGIVKFSRATVSAGDRLQKLQRTGTKKRTAKKSKQSIHDMLWG